MGGEPNRRTERPRREHQRTPTEHEWSRRLVVLPHASTRSKRRPACDYQRPKETLRLRPAVGGSSGGGGSAPHDKSIMDAGSVLVYDQRRRRPSINSWPNTVKCQRLFDTLQVAR